MITRSDLEAFSPQPRSTTQAEIWSDYLDAILASQDSGELDRAEIDNPDRWCHLLAQWAHECNGFTLLWESGSYSESRILKIFGEGRHSARISKAEAKRLASLPSKDRGPALFERAYGLGNPRKARELGNTEPGDGWRFRGFGIQQITGRRDHERLIAGNYTASGAVTAALLEWGKKGCNEHADNDDLRRVTRLINGGYNGLSDRERWLRKARRVFGHKYPAGAADASHEAAHEPATSADPVEPDIPVPTPAPRREVIAPPVPPSAPLPPPSAPPSADLEGKSKTVSLFATIKRWISRIFFGGSTFSFADVTVNGGKNVEVVLVLVAKHPGAVIGIVAALLAGGWLAAWWTINRRRLEIAEGRYRPSGHV